MEEEGTTEGDIHVGGDSCVHKDMSAGRDNSKEPGSHGGGESSERVVERGER